MTYTVSVTVRGNDGTEKLQWGFGNPPDEGSLERDEPYPNINEHNNISTSTMTLRQTTDTWPERIWFRFYNDASYRAVYLENIRIDDKGVEYVPNSNWANRLSDAAERWGSDPHPFGMYWQRNYVALIQTEEPNELPWIWIGVGIGTVLLLIAIFTLL